MRRRRGQRGRPGAWSALLAAVAVAFVASACGLDTPAPNGSDGSTAPSPRPATAPPAASVPPVELKVLAAAALTDVAPALATAYAATHSGVTLTFTFGASNTLAAQVGQGAPADLFLSADVDAAASLVDDGVTVGAETPFTANRLALVVPAGSKKVARLADLAKPGLRIAGTPAGVPLSTAVDALLVAAEATKGIPRGFAAAVSKSTQSSVADERAVLAAVMGGRADAGFVYATDAASAAAAVTVIPLAETLNDSIPYAGVVARTSANPDAAAAFLAWLLSRAGQTTLVEAGFLPISE